MTESSSLRLGVDLLKLAVKNLLRRPLRSLLTVLGIAIGMTAVVGLLGLTGGVQLTLERQFARLGHDLVLILPAAPPGSVPSEASPIRLEPLRSLPGVARLGALLRQILEVTTPNVLAFPVVLGLSAETFALADRFFERFEVERGRLPMPDDHEVLLTQGAARDLKLSEGDVLQIADQEFRVSGVLEPTGDSRTEGAIVMPLSQLWELTGKRDRVTFAWVQAQPDYDVQRLAATLDEALRTMGANFTVQSSTRLNQIVQTLLRAIKAALSAIAAVALLVGGIGLMNTMYMAVLERTREIGIFLSLGARQGQILMLFLMEAGLLGLAGGLFGVLFGAGVSVSLSLLISQVAGGGSFVPVISPSLFGLSLLFSMGLGMLAGWLPAQRAASLRPVEALRYE